MLSVVVAAILSVHYVVAKVVVQVAALAEGCEVGKSVIVFIAVKVRNGKHNARCPNLFYTLIVTKLANVQIMMK